MTGVSRAFRYALFGTYVLSDDPSLEDAVIQTVIKRLRQRGRLAQIAAVGTIVLILIALIVGLFFFYYAGAITQFDRNVLVERAIRELSYRIDRAEEADGVDQAELHELKAMQRELLNEIKNTQNVDVSFVVSTLTTRLGAAALLLFLIQILVPMYRYNTRLSGFYHSRADALQLIRTADFSQLSMLVDVLAPDDVEFGRAPKTPTQEIIDLAVKLAGNEKSKGTG